MVTGDFNFVENWITDRKNCKPNSGMKGSK